MKKVYLAPQPEAIQLISANVMMAGRGGGTTYVNPIEGMGTGSSGNR